ncbi:ABC transporter substrate-binding protein [Streptomyces carminius]|uniref:ABC transporter substrate-binding protein n=1 Tax=Streptomyces carminius TaxID=2665496 RepID=UPI0013043426|nr:extracellular solute-binding protein [Streptomyces carminius]
MRRGHGARGARTVRGGLAGRAARTALLGLLCLLLAPAGLAGCVREVGGARHTLVVLGSWTGGEQEAFEELLDRFEERQRRKGFHVEVRYQGTTANREVLLSDVLAGDPPDIVVLPSLGDLIDYRQRGRLEPLRRDVDVRGAYDRGPWLARPQGMRKRYWLPVRADLKSLVWYTGREPDASDAAVDHWCVGMGSDATSGWPGTDWVEDILLQQSGPEVYERWANGELAWDAEPVVKAWNTWADFMSGDGGRAARAALEADHRGPEGGSGLLFDPARDCRLEHQGSFARHLYGERFRDADFVPAPRLLPGVTNRGSRDREVSGDFAAMFQYSRKAEELMHFLASLEAQLLWTKHDTAWRRGEIPFFSAHQGIGEKAYPERDAVGRRVVRELEEAGYLCLDASDTMPPAVRGIFQQKILEFLADPRQEHLAETGTRQRRLVPLRQIQEVQERYPRESGPLDVCAARATGMP